MKSSIEESLKLQAMLHKEWGTSPETIKKVEEFFSTPRIVFETRIRRTGKEKPEKNPDEQTGGIVRS
jgi:hypothetical protein